MTLGGAASHPTTQAVHSESFRAVSHARRCGAPGSRVTHEVGGNREYDCNAWPWRAVASPTARRRGYWIAISFAALHEPAFGTSRHSAGTQQLGRFREIVLKKSERRGTQKFLASQARFW